MPSLDSEKEADPPDEWSAGQSGRMMHSVSILAADLDITDCHAKITRETHSTGTKTGTVMLWACSSLAGVK